MYNASMSRLDYHHIPKVLDLVDASGAHAVLEAHDGEALYVPLVRAFLPTVKRTDDARAKDAHGLRTSYDVVLCHVSPGAETHALLDHVRALLDRHRGVIVVAPKRDWEKADFAGVGPALFVNDPTGIIVYLAKTADIKSARRKLLQRRVRRQSTFTPTVEAVFRSVRRVRKTKSA
ncbi:hypothetical protein EDM68_00400 [Candidatus Uhrbacteria bacterium]|nr:MAG: hypothetical protein EDM68_00400 [Candidatus Uhrbacteria bacterium]